MLTWIYINRFHSVFVNQVQRGYTLEDLTNGLGVSLANVFSGMEFLTSFDPLLRHAEQPVWQDPESGYIRRSLPPQGLKTSSQLVEVHFPVHAHVTYDIMPCSSQSGLSLGNLRFNWVNKLINCIRAIVLPSVLIIPLFQQSKCRTLSLSFSD